MINNTISKLYNKYIINDNNEYAYIGIKNSEYKYFKKTYGKPIFINMDDYDIKNDLNTFISLNENNYEKIINIINNTKGNCVLKVPKSFQFNKFIKDVNLDHYDVYNSNNNSVDYYFIGIKKNEKN